MAPEKAAAKICAGDKLGPAAAYKNNYEAQ
jgi:hypothetical protein